ncbi:MAG: cation diffusion facilitator family transporter [Cyanobacteria bacterium P01_H01_bin.58]
MMVSVLGFAGIELWMGTLSHSLTLQADSGHMLADGVAIGMALTAAWLTRRSPAKTHNTQLELWAALINGLGLLAMAGWIAREALAHLDGQPTEILSLPMLITALLGLIINSLNLYWLHGDAHQDLNVRGVFLHILADLLGSVGAILAALAVTFLRWMWADALIGAVVACAIALSAVPLLLQSLRHIFIPKQTLASLSLDPQSGWLEVGKTDLSHLIVK